jgi:glutathione synthase/RimK-type ligase-like ATP-grasp enzyme
LKPTVLIVTSSRWFPTARLAVSLANAGCTVQAVYPSGHPITKTAAVTRGFEYRGLAPLQSIAAAIAATSPDLLVSGDDLASRHLHQLYEQNARTGHSGSAICALIERSIGAPENFTLIDDRASFMQVAQQAGVRIPQTALVPDFVELDRLAARVGFPIVLKANGTWGGEGVRVAKNIEESSRALRALQAPPLLARAMKRALFDCDTTLVRRSFLRRGAAVIAQAYIAGAEATSAVACWKGEILASLHFAVLEKSRSSGHATVLRRIEHPEMTSATQKIARRLSLSGFHGFDFMLDDRANDAYLIEINPRATQVGHLALGPGRDLAGALLSALTCAPARPSPSVTENDTIALFPQEWLRDPSSPYLHSGYHDVPWDQPELVRACVSNPGALGSFLLTRMKSD